MRCWHHHPISTYLCSSLCLHLAWIRVYRHSQSIPREFCTIMRWGHRKLITRTTRRDHGIFKWRLLAKSRTNTFFLLKSRPSNARGCSSCWNADNGLWECSVSRSALEFVPRRTRECRLAAVPVCICRCYLSKRRCRKTRGTICPWEASHRHALAISKVIEHVTETAYGRGQK